MLSKCIILSCMMWLRFPSFRRFVACFSFFFVGFVSWLFHLTLYSFTFVLIPLQRILRYECVLRYCLRPWHFVYCSVLLLYFSRRVADKICTFGFFGITRKSCFEIRYKKLYSFAHDMDIHSLWIYGTEMTHEFMSHVHLKRDRTKNKKKKRALTHTHGRNVKD